MRPAYDSSRGKVCNSGIDIRFMFYRFGYLKSLATTINLPRYFSQIAFKYHSTVNGGRISSEIEDITAQFQIENALEYRRAKWMLGEGNVLRQLLSEVGSDHVFWDVGANTGTYGSYVLAKSDETSVVAFEPEPKNAEQLRKNLELNGDPERWQVEEIALSDENATANLDVQAAKRGAGGHELSERGIEVPTRRGVDLVENQGLPAPDSVKIDVEGAELLVTRGMADLLKDVELLLCEVHPARLQDGSVDELVSIFENAGLKVSDPQQRGGTHHLFCRR